jgi:stage II sporulation protein R
MKKGLSVIIAIVCLVILCLAFIPGRSDENSEYLRIHIRANSNSSVDQNIKYEVKNAVVDYLTPRLAECESREKAYALLKSALSEIRRTVDKILKNNRFNYASEVVLVNEEFPARAYDDLVLEAGYYDALLILLGEGTGDNWWCAVYPPLCFVGEYNPNGQIKYKSKLMEIIENFKKGR